MAIVFDVPVMDVPAKPDVPVEVVPAKPDVPVEVVSAKPDVPVEGVSVELDVSLEVNVGVDVPVEIDVPVGVGVAEVSPAEVWTLAATPAGRIFRSAETWLPATEQPTRVSTMAPSITAPTHPASNLDRTDRVISTLNSSSCSR